jgi:peptide deformylase
LPQPSGDAQTGSAIRADPLPGAGCRRPEVEGKAEEFHARIIQHECDHLDRILYPDRIEEREMFGFIEELQAAGLIPGALPRESPRRPR